MVRLPLADELKQVAREYGIALTEEELKTAVDLAHGVITSYDRVGSLPEPKLPVRYPRVTGRRPAREENPLNAFAWICDLTGAPGGKLAGKRIGIKDNVAVAGVPMVNGSAVLDGYIPDVDATIVSRMLDAGGRIVGKLTCDNFCFSGGGHTAASGPVLNPHSKGFLAGGSSGGSAAAVVNGNCDIAIGGDQGGSIRIPSSWCGAYGLKPTKGLVPYTGVFPIEATLDHVGPIANTTYDVALCLEVIAGTDGLDPRQSGLDVKAEEYTKLLDGVIRNLHFGVVKEGFGWEGASQPDVDRTVREAANLFKEKGAQVTEISIPIHRDGIHIWYPIILEGSLEMMIRREGLGMNLTGYYDTGLLNFYSNARRARANDYPYTVKVVILLAEYLTNMYHGAYYAKAQNISRDLTKGYDDAFEKVDLLIMPTTPMKAMPYVENQTPAEFMSTALGMIHNTCPFDVTGHPAINIPCGMSEGLPVGMMIVGRLWHDSEVLRASYAFEQARKGNVKR